VAAALIACNGLLPKLLVE